MVGCVVGGRAPMNIHLFLDMAAWLCAWLVARFIFRRGYLQSRPRTPITDPGYFILL